MLVAKLSRTWVSNPLSFPGTTATWLCSSRAAEKLTASVIFVSLAFLCGALAAGLPGAGRRLILAGYGFVGAGVVAAVALELVL